MSNVQLTRRDFLKAMAVGAGALSMGPLLEACAAPATSAPPVKIGVLLSYSKVYAALGNSITQGMQLYFDSVNNIAGGRPITLIKEDEENDPQVSLTKTRKLIEQDKVDIFTGVISTTVVYALRDLLDSSKMISLISNAGGNDLTRKRKSPYIFRTSFSSWQVAYPLGPWVAQNVSKKVMVVAADYGFGHESADAFKDSFTKAGGTILGELYPPFPSTDFGAFLPKIAAAKPEAIYAFFSGSDATNFVKQFADFGLSKDIKITGSGFLVEQDVLPAQGAAANGAYSTLHWALTLDNPENKKFVDDYKAKFNATADVFALQGFDTARVIVEALNAVKGDTSNKDNLLQAIRAVKFNSPRGPFVFDQTTQNVNQYIYYRQVRDTGGGALANVVLGKTDQLVVDPGA
ncbi:MAG TPA: ABC transporter substrate-binding protein [Anaerolineae bacterium]